MSQRLDTVFTTAEPVLIRLQFLMRFGQAPRRWHVVAYLAGGGRSASRAAQGVPAMRSMLDRSLVTIKLVRSGARAYFTEDGYAALRVLAQDCRALNSSQYGHRLEELGLKPAVMTALAEAAEG